MLLSQIQFILLAAAGAEALWLATADMSYNTATNGGGIYGSPVCQVGKGDTQDQAISQATSQGSNSVAIAGVQKCSELSSQHTNQLGGFWDDYGAINYEDGNTHWYCSIGGAGACDAGDGTAQN